MSSESTQSKTIFKALPITYNSDYDSVLAKLPHNAMYVRELLVNSIKDFESEKLYYFLLQVDGEPAILMPFILKNISSNLDNVDLKDVSSPYGYSGPIFHKDIDTEYLTVFWFEIKKWYLKNNVITEFIRFNLQQNWINYDGLLKPTLNNVCGKIIDKDDQWAGFKPKVRNNFRTAEKMGVQAKIFHTNINERELKKFCKIYILTMKRNKAAKKYFYEYKLIKKFINKNSSRCALAIAYLNNKAISAELLLLSKSEVLSFLGGTLQDYFYTRPNDYLKVKILDWARSEGYSYYLLGGGLQNDDSLYNYKKQFFPKDSDRIFYTGRKIINGKIYMKLCALDSKEILTGALKKNNFPEYS